MPELAKIIKIAQHFGVSLDALILGNDNRITEELKGTAMIKPQYANIHDWEFYSSNLETEYRQSLEEGLPFTLHTSIFGIDTVKISDRIQQTLDCIRQR